MLLLLLLLLLLQTFRTMTRPQTLFLQICLRSSLYFTIYKLIIGQYRQL